MWGRISFCNLFSKLFKPQSIIKRFEIYPNSVNSLYVKISSTRISKKFVHISGQPGHSITKTLTGKYYVNKLGVKIAKVIRKFQNQKNKNSKKNYSKQNLKKKLKSESKLKRRRLCGRRLVSTVPFNNGNYCYNYQYGHNDNSCHSSFKFSTIFFLAFLCIFFLAIFFKY